MFETIRFKALAAATGLAIALGVSSASAVTLGTCETAFGSVADRVEPTSACYSFFDLADGDAAKLAGVNSVSIGGETGSWGSLGKFENTGSNDYFSLNDNTTPNQAGFWALTNKALAEFSEFLMIFKGGNINNTVPSDFVGYILSGESGTWQSPLLATTGNPGSTRDLSNVELFARGTGTPPNGDPGNGNGTAVIPLPAAGWLLLTAIGGLGATGLRRRRKNA